MGLGRGYLWRREKDDRGRKRDDPSDEAGFPLRFNGGKGTEAQREEGRETVDEQRKIKS